MLVKKFYQRLQNNIYCKAIMNAILEKYNLEWHFIQFLGKINKRVWREHDSILKWAEGMAPKKELYEVDSLYRNTNDVIAKQGYFLKNKVIDLEGLDFEVITALNLEKYRPEVICIEALTYSENKTGIKINNIIEYILSSGYFIYADTYINTIFVDIRVWEKR